MDSPLSHVNKLGCSGSDGCEPDQKEESELTVYSNSFNNAVYAMTLTLIP